MRNLCACGTPADIKVFHPLNHLLAKMSLTGESLEMPAATISYISHSQRPIAASSSGWQNHAHRTNCKLSGTRWGVTENGPANNSRLLADASLWNIVSSRRKGQDYSGSSEEILSAWSSLDLACMQLEICGTCCSGFWSAYRKTKQNKQQQHQQ